MLSRSSHIVDREVETLKEKKEPSIVRGTLLLTIANLLLRLAAMSFQIYLSGRIGAAASAFYS